MIVRCTKCGTLRLATESTSAVDDSTSSAFDPHHSSAKKRGLTELACSLLGPLTLRWKTRLVATHVPAPGPILEVGCGTGEMASSLVQKGYEVVGIEPDDHARHHAHSNLGVTVFSNIEEAPGGFSAAVLWHVLEHVDTPVSFLNQVKSHLLPGGILFIAVPNAASLDASMYGPSWIAWDVPRHLSHFEPSSLLNVLLEAGFEVRVQSSVPSDTLFNCVASEILAPSASRWTLPFRLGRALVRTLWIWSTVNRSDPNQASSLLVVARAVQNGLVSQG